MKADARRLPGSDQRPAGGSRRASGCAASDPATRKPYDRGVRCAAAPTEWGTRVVAKTSAVAYS
jgi:hypothetical protein